MTGVYFKAEARFLKLEFSTYLGFAGISTTGCDQLGIFLPCTEAMWVPVLVGLTQLGKKLRCLQQRLHLQCLILVMLRFVIWLHLSLVTKCYIGDWLSAKMFMTEVFFVFVFFWWWLVMTVQRSHCIFIAQVKWLFPICPIVAFNCVMRKFILYPLLLFWKCKFVMRDIE